MAEKVGIKVINVNTSIGISRTVVSLQHDSNR